MPPATLLRIVEVLPTQPLAAVLDAETAEPTTTTVPLTTPPPDAPWSKNLPAEITPLTAIDVKTALPDLNLDTATKHLTPAQSHRLAQLLLHYQHCFTITTAELGNTPFPPVCIPLDTDTPIVGCRFRTSPECRTRRSGSSPSSTPRTASSTTPSPRIQHQSFSSPRRTATGCFAVDYRALNQHVIPNPYPLPRIDDTLDALHGNNWFSSLDLQWGFWNMRCAPGRPPQARIQHPRRPQAMVGSPSATGTPPLSSNGT